jgi:hypothetical protein
LLGLANSGIGKSGEFLAHLKPRSIVELLLVEHVL